MAAKKAKKRKSSKKPSAAQLRARRAFAAAAKARSKAAKKKRAGASARKPRAAAQRRNPALSKDQLEALPFLQRNRVENEQMSARLSGAKVNSIVLNADKTVTVSVTNDYGTYTATFDRKGKSKNPRRRNKTVIVKPKRVLVLNGRKRAAKKARNPRYFAYGVDATGREYDLAIRVAANKTQTLQWVKAHYPGYKKYVVTLDNKADFIGRDGMIKIKRPRRSRKANPLVSPKVKQIRKEFAGRVTGFKQMNAPDGTPKSLAKLGKLVLIRTQGGTIKPATGTTWLCADAKGKLHLSTTAARLHEGSRHNFGHVSQVEYEEQKPHLGYPKKTIFFHKMGERGGKQPTLIADGKGGLRFRGGSYKITREGIVN